MVMTRRNKKLEKPTSSTRGGAVYGESKEDQESKAGQVEQQSSEVVMVSLHKDRHGQVNLTTVSIIYLSPRRTRRQPKVQKR